MSTHRCAECERLFSTVANPWRCPACRHVYERREDQRGAEA